LFATAAGLSFAFQAAVTKVFMNELGYGMAAILSSWATYALIITALAGFGLQQSALKTGYLAPAMAACNATTLAVSVWLGVSVFQESISQGQERLFPAIIGLALAIIGVLMLASPESRRGESAAQ
jgi:multidrug transporter EmrE-like cation transporter